MEQLDNSDGGQGSGGGWLHHRGVAAQEGRGDLVPHEGDVEVPGDDDSHNTHGAFQDEAILIGLQEGNIAATEALPWPSVVL